VQVGTNGILLRDGFEQIDSVDRWVVPLDGAGPAVHNALRFWGDRHFDVIVDRLARLRAAGKSTTVSTVVTRVNAHDVRHIARMLRELNSTRPFIHAWHLYQFIPQGRGGAAQREQLQLSIDQYDQICQPINSQDLGFTVFKRPDMLRSHTVEFFSMRDGLLHRQLGDQQRIEELCDATPTHDQATTFC
jgi:sulfatase maturation enzyme AslB (radical SAM superfamily)